jgi:hypothetical protein
MSLLSALILPKLEKELVDLEPEIAQFLLGQMKVMGSELLAWVETKINLPEQSKEEAGE